MIVAKKEYCYGRTYGEWMVLATHEVYDCVHSRRMVLAAQGV